jgi:uncharacterized protein (TIGR02996 family)
MGTEDALWAAVGHSPGDALPRLVLADWLEENNHDGGPCVTCGGHGLIDANGVGSGEGTTCEPCLGFGEFIPDGRADLAAALRATAQFVPLVEDGTACWFNGRNQDGSVHPASDVPSTLFAGFGTPDSYIVHTTAEAALRDLCRAYIAAHITGGVPA